MKFKVGKIKTTKLTYMRTYAYSKMTRTNNAKDNYDPNGP